MTAEKSIASALAAGLAVILGLAAFNHQAAKEGRTARDALARRHASLLSGLRRIEDRIATAERAPPSPGAGSASDPEPSVRGISPGGAPDLGANFLTLVASDPKLSSLAMKAFQASLALTYGPLFRTLHFPPEEAAKFDALAAGHQQAQLDIVTTASAQGVPADDDAVATLLSQENDDYVAAERALLGEAGFQRMRQLGRVQPMMEITRNLAMSVSLTSQPLTPTQIDQLSQVLADASGDYQSGGRATVESIDWAAALDRARTIVSPGQFENLQGLYAQSAANQLRIQFINQETEAR